MIKRLNLGIVKPSFLIIGAQKSGTSALHHYLRQHQDILSPLKKELHYFDNRQLKPIRDYLKQFPTNYFSRKISFESTPRYLYFPGTAEKISSFNPKMKFIVLIRNPAKRAYSAWNMYKQIAKNNKLVNYFDDLEKVDKTQQFYSFFYKGDFPSFQKCIEHELGTPNYIEPAIVRRGHYKRQIEEYFEVFDEEQFLFIESENLKNDTTNALKSILNFLELDEFRTKNLDLSEQHIRKYENDMSSKLYKKLYNHYLKINNGLEDLIDLEIPWMQKI